MERLPVLIKSNGQWNEDHNYVNYVASGEFKPTKCKYEELLQILLTSLGCENSSTTLQIQYQAKEGIPPIKICNDRSLYFYLELKMKETDFTTYPLCVNQQNNNTTPAATPNSISTTTPYEYNVAMIENNTTTLENNITTTESYTTGQQTKEGEQSETIEDEEDKFDIIDYANLVAEEMVEQLENTSKKLDPEIDINNAKLITDKQHPEVEKGQAYKDKETLKNVLSYFAIKNNFQYKVWKSCSQEYSLKCVYESCNWSLRASRNGPTNTFIIRRFSNMHTCPINIRHEDQRQATSKLIGECIKPKFLNIKTKATAMDIKGELKYRFGIKMNYMKAWRSKEHAVNDLRGNASDSYSLIPSFLHMVEKTNPGSFVDLKTAEDNSLLFVFMALDASIKGWGACRPIVVVDGTFLKAAYGGTLLCACTQDAAGHIFPLAFCVADSENDQSWKWFFKKFKEAYGVREHQCLISDRNESLIKAAREIYPEIAHSYCGYHILSNLKTSFKQHAAKYNLPFFGAVKAYTEKQFEFHMAELDGLDKRIRPYLKKIGYEKWSRIHSQNKRYSTMTSNISESLNAANLAARELPITTLLECLRALVQQWTHTNRTKAQNTFTKLPPTGEDILLKNYTYSLNLEVKATTDYFFEVTRMKESWEVDLEKRTCTCNRFQIDEMPCGHAVAVMREMNMDPYTYCSDYYTKKNWLATYSGTVYPIGHQSEWEVPEEVKNIIVLPPHERVKSGRPKTLRRKAGWEKDQHNKCSKCGELGHNKRTCSRRRRRE
ncbi:hypothetical protein CsatB_007783 [Cannabis sativa]|uniref:uncharacterized protein LOC133032270 n=1 Tax=Cannabis sativa TaxID=3483 RepID=UPI0029CA9BAD|nr:uncharacterized protein LOC133032270 [Cannabis sativa]